MEAMNLKDEEKGEEQDEEGKDEEEQEKKMDGQTDNPEETDKQMADVQEAQDNIPQDESNEVSHIFKLFCFLLSSQ